MSKLLPTLNENKSKFENYYFHNKEQNNGVK